MLPSPDLGPLKPLGNTLGQRGNQSEGKQKSNILSKFELREQVYF